MQDIDDALVTDIYELLPHLTDAQYEKIFLLLKHIQHATPSYTPSPGYQKQLLHALYTQHIKHHHQKQPTLRGRLQHYRKTIMIAPLVLVFVVTVWWTGWLGWQPYTEHRFIVSPSENTISKYPSEQPYTYTHRVTPSSNEIRTNNPSNPFGNMIGIEEGPKEANNDDTKREENTILVDPLVGSSEEQEIVVEENTEILDTPSISVKDTGSQAILGRTMPIGGDTPESAPDTDMAMMLQPINYDETDEILADDVNDITVGQEDQHISGAIATLTLYISHINNQTYELAKEMLANDTVLAHEQIAYYKEHEKERKSINITIIDAYGIEDTHAYYVFLSVRIDTLFTDIHSETTYMDYTLIQEKAGSSRIIQKVSYTK